MLDFVGKIHQRDFMEQSWREQASLLRLADHRTGLLLWICAIFGGFSFFANFENRWYFFPSFDRILSDVRFPWSKYLPFGHCALFRCTFGRFILSPVSKQQPWQRMCTNRLSQHLIIILHFDAGSTDRGHSVCFLCKIQVRSSQQKPVLRSLCYLSHDLCRDTSL